MRAVLSRTASVVAVATAALVPAAAPASELGERTLERGDSGDDVRELQDALTRIGVPTEADGSFGASTVASVRRYERREGLTVDGRVTPAQARGLLRAAPEMPPPGGAGDATPGGATPGEAAPGGELPGGGAEPAADAPERAFPVDGAHTYGDGFGDRANHKGADILAACGTPLRAVQAGTVRRLATEGSAGRYIVLRAGERVGSVGQTGNATTCHLHFEAWSAPGWYAGGSPHDPASLLRSPS